MINQKLPEPGEWWISYCDAIAYICGFDPDGDPVFLTDRKENAHVDTMSGFLENWHHEPLCTGWDWKPPAPIDPGEGWEVLPKRVLLIAGDQVLQDGGDWLDTVFVGDEANDACIYRRRKPPVETWPRYYVTILNSDGYYHCVSESEVWHICSAEIVRQSAKAQTLTNKSVWREVTESEAKARVKPADPLPALIPGIATDRMVDLFLSWRLPSDFQPDGGISFTSRPIHESWPTGTNLFTATQARGMIEHLLSVPEETSRVKPAEPIDQATKALHDLAIDAGIDPLGLDPAEIAEKLIAKQQVTGCSGESPGRVPYNRPARDVVMEIVKLLADSSMTDEESADRAFQIGTQWLDDNPESDDPPPFSKPSTSARSGMGIQKDHVSWRPNSGQYDAATDVTYQAETPVESPDDWVDLPETHILRADIDQVLYEHDTINYWQEVGPSAGMRLNDSQYKRARCRRRDLPAPQPKTMDVSPGEGWRWVEKDEPWQEGDDCLICDFTHPHTHNCQCWRRRIVPQPKRIPVRLWCLKNNVQNVGSGVIACVENPDSGCDMWQKVKFDGSGFYVEGGE